MIACYSALFDNGEGTEHGVEELPPTVKGTMHDHRFKNTRAQQCSYSNGHLQIVVQFWKKLQYQSNEAEHCYTIRSSRSQLEKVRLTFSSSALQK